MIRAALPLCLCLVAGCAAPEAAPEDGAALAAAQLPTPYTDEQLREAHPEGKVRVFRIDVPGQPSFVNTMTFSECDAAGTTVASQRTTLEGKPMGASVTQRSAWTELRDHALFDAADTTRERATLATARGDVACWLYVNHKTGATTRFWFAVDVPGPPLLLEIEKDGELTYRMEQLEPPQAEVEVGLALPAIDADALATWRDRILPGADELGWRSIPWLDTFEEGIRVAGAEQRPLLFWAMNGHPLGCT
jgi:hypothetical protein